MGLEDRRGGAHTTAQVHKSEQIVLSLRGLVTLRDGITHDDLPGFFARAHGLVSGWQVGVIVCDVGALTKPDIAALDGLARIQLFVRRHGKVMKLRSADQSLTQFLDFTGFKTCLPKVEGEVPVRTG